MNAKRSLHNRIRGWFPEEPKSLKLSIVPTFEANTSNPQNSYTNAKTQVSILSIGNLLFWNVMSLFWLIRIFVNLSITDFMVLMVIGAVIGASLGAVPTYRVLKALAQGRKTHANLSEIIVITFILLALPIVLFSAFFAGQNPLYHISEIQYMLFVFIYSSALSIADSRIILFSIWERKNNCKILRGKRLTLFVYPKISSNTISSQNNQKLES